MRPLYATRLTVFVAPGRQNEHDRLAALARAQIEHEAGAQAWQGAVAWACPLPLQPDEQGRQGGLADRRVHALELVPHRRLEPVGGRDHRRRGLERLLQGGLDSAAR